MIIRCLDPWGTIRVPIRVLQGLGCLEVHGSVVSGLEVPQCGF